MLLKKYQVRNKLVRIGSQYFLLICSRGRGEEEQGKVGEGRERQQEERFSWGRGLGSTTVVKFY